MKKIKYLLIIIILFTLSGCKSDVMDDINIATSVYPIDYVVKNLYGEHSTVNSIYPMDSDITEFEVTEVLLEQYSDNELFIFNGLSEEKNYIKPMLKNNKDLKIIDVSSNMHYDYSIEELWLDPNNLLTIANNIKNGFDEYINSKYLVNEINKNYEELKINLTMLEGKYYSTFKKSDINTIIVSNDSFKYLEKYGVKVISLDKDTRKDKDINNAKELLSNGDCKYIFIKYKEELDSKIEDIISDTNSTTMELYTFTNLSNINIEQTDYIVLMNQNLENLKMELLK